MTATGPETFWYKDAIFYEVRVRSFADSDGDGTGDFKGLAAKLDYLKDLGVTVIWLLPFYPSPLRDDGYDISDYVNVHPDCGRLEDFKSFLKQAHDRGLRVVTELVLNHTSDQHPWFQRARRAKPGSVERDYYVWSDDPSRYGDARVIFKDFEHSNWAWDGLAKSYYWHRFYSHQPDLNFDSPAVRKEMKHILDFWMQMGVDGVRLDAVPYLYEREGTNCENLDETHAFLRELRAHVEKKYPDRMFLAEANQWPDDAAAYFGKGDECHMAFHFPIMPRMFMGIHMEDRLPLVDILAQTPPIPDSCQWALFLRNHDELTLEMVTDEERDYMYKVYANDPGARINLGIRRRLAPLLGNHRRKMELMNGLLFSLPGTPVIYYGDEIGMGDNIFLGDRNGVRTPMQWSSDKNAGFSRANPQRMLLPIIIDPEYHYESVNVEAQNDNQHSLLRWMKRLIALRKKYRAFGQGSIEFLYPRNNKVLTYVRKHGNETILVVANLSRFVQYVELDLSAYKGSRPVEMFGRIEFPPIGELPYFITLGPHAFYWFSLELQRVKPSVMEPESLPELEIAGDWSTALTGTNRSGLESVLPYFLKTQRWFGGKARQIRSVRISDVVPWGNASAPVYLTFVLAEYAEGNAETYLLPVGFAGGEEGRAILKEMPGLGICWLRGRGRDHRYEGLLYDAVGDNAFTKSLLDGIVRRREAEGNNGVAQGIPSARLGPKAKAALAGLEPRRIKAEQSNSSVVFGDTYIFKLIRRLDFGLHPDAEIGRFLTDKARFPHVASLAGELGYLQPKKEPVTLGLLFQYVPNEGDAWKYTQKELEVFFSGVKGKPFEPGEKSSAAVASLAGKYLESAALLGKRTAELHLALSGAEDAAFRPEWFAPFSQRSLYQSLRGLNQRAFGVLSQRIPFLPSPLQELAASVQGYESEVLAVFETVRKEKIRSTQIRCHGDFHLGQVLYTGRDFVIIDFEGEPARSLSERRIKRSPLRDVAGMIRSFHYAAYAAIKGQPDESELEPWADTWIRAVSDEFLRSYTAAAGNAEFLPKDTGQRGQLLNVFLLEKAVYEMTYELNNRPEWVRIPILGILQILGKRHP